MKVNLKKNDHPVQFLERPNSPKLLITAPMHFLPEVRRQLEEKYSVTYAFRVSRSSLIELLIDCDAWIVDPGANYHIDAELLSYAKNLKFLVSPSTGSDHIDLEYCKNSNIRFDCLKGKEDVISNIHASAEFSFALLLAMVRKMIPANYAAEKGYWREIEDNFRGIELGESTIGLIGYGRIGKKMANYSKAFGAKVVIYDPYKVVEKHSELIQTSTLEELLAQSDIVCLHVHLERETMNMFSFEQFKKMKKGSYFLNTSRGGLANEEAMLDALASGHIAAAAVDVISGEQEDDFYNHKVIQYARNHSNLVVSPHIAGLTSHSQGKAALFAVETLNKFFWD